MYQKWVGKFGERRYDAIKDVAREEQVKKRCEEEGKRKTRSMGKLQTGEIYMQISICREEKRYYEKDTNDKSKEQPKLF